jgi:hypothetical protein
MNIPKFNSTELIKLLLNQRWHSECQIIHDYMPPHPGKNTRPTVVVMYPNVYENTFLRYSCGPDQGFFWDVYGDDMLSVEIAIVALSKAPIPLNYRRAEYPIRFPI